MKNENIMVVPEAEMRAIVKETVDQIFLNLGMNTSDAEAVGNFQQDMHFLRKERTRKEMLEVRITTHVVLMFITAAASVLGTYILNGAF